MSEIVSQDEVAWEGVGERVVELEHLQKRITLDDVQIAVGQSTDICHWLADCRVLAELVTEHVSLAWFYVPTPQQKSAYNLHAKLGLFEMSTFFLHFIMLCKGSINVYIPSEWADKIHCKLEKHSTARIYSHAGICKAALQNNPVILVRGWSVVSSSSNRLWTFMG